MPRETLICLMPQAICFNNSSSVICAVPFTIVAQIEHFIQNFTMTYLSFRRNCFMFVGKSYIEEKCVKKKMTKIYI